MRWAILSDVHGNLPALEAVMSYLDEGRAVDRIAYLGDAVGYGADPNACLEILRAACCEWVVGNHDHGVVGLTEIHLFNLEAKEAILWCRDQLESRHRDFLRGLPLEVTKDDFTLVHATPQAPRAWNYLLSYDDVEEAFAVLNTDLCFVGHSHIPLVLRRDQNKRIQSLEPNEARILPTRSYIINPGSIGQPRNGDPRASFGIYDDEHKTFQLHRVPYDIQDATQRILRAGLPPSLAHRLHVGL
jgi:putative phosphoesterase